MHMRDKRAILHNIADFGDGIRENAQLFIR